MKRLFLALLLFCIPLNAQDKSGALSGTVSDDSGAVFPAVKVTVTNTANQRTIVTRTIADGTYFVRDLEPGEYSVRFDLSGFSPVEFNSVMIFAGRGMKIDTHLQPGLPDSRAVAVNESVRAIEMERPIAPYIVSAADIERLPKSRTFSYFGIAAPRINTGEIEGGIQTNGASGAENVFYVDNATINSLIDGRVRQNVPFEYLQEVNITTAGFDATYPGALGGSILAITRSGGNGFHGSGQFYWSGDKLSASPVQRLVLAAAGNVSSYAQDEKSPIRILEPGFSLGGPLRKNGLYFFTAASPRISKQDQLYRFNNGGETGVITRDQTLMSWFTKVSWDASPKLRAAASWLYTPSTAKGSGPSYDAAGPNWLSTSKASNEANRQIGFFQPQSSYSADLNYSLSNNFVLSGRGSYFWDNYKDTGYPAITPVRYATPNNLASTGSLQGPAGTQNTPITRFRSHDLVTRAFGHADAAINGEFYGYHDLRAGYDIQKNINKVFDSFVGGAYVMLYWDQTFTLAGRNDRGTYGYYEVNEFGKVGSAGAATSSAYVQDTWKALPRLTLNLGVRLNRETLPSFRRDIQSTALTHWADTMAPRIGGSFDLRGDGEVKVYGSWNRFVDSTKYDWVRNAFGADIWKIYYRSLDTLDVFTLSLANKPGRDLWLLGSPYRDVRRPGFGKSSIDPEIKPMSQDQIAAGVQIELRPQFVVGAQYLRNNLRRTIEDLIANIDGKEGYIYANPGEGLAKTYSGVTGPTPAFPYPKPVRQYDAVEFSAEARSSKGWFARTSYTWSRLWGNYAGLANSDRVLTPTTNLAFSAAQQQGGSIAQPASNASMSYDLDELLWDSKGHLDVQGPLPTDRPHVFKATGGYRFLKGTDIGAFFYLGSGTPLTTQVTTLNQAVVFVNGRGDLGRTPWLNYTDLLVAHDFHFAERQTMRIEFNMLNAFNQKTTRHRFSDLNRGVGVFDPAAAMDLSAVNLSKGYDYTALLKASPKGLDAFDPRYGKDDLFTSGFTGRLGLKWTF